jgi:4'-phosphopantetheinyl transferase
MNADRTGLGRGAEIWFVDISHAGAALLAVENAEPRVSSDETSHARSLGSQGDAWLAFRIALRLVLERHAGPKVRGLALVKAAGGKPRLPWTTDLDFSLSHSGELGLIAVAGGQVGIDIEQAREVTFPDVRKTAIVAAAKGVGGEDGDPSPLRSWVSLEAWAKARGSGIGGLLSDLGIWGAGAPAADTGDLARHAMDLLASEGLKVADLSLPQEAVGAVALPRELPVPPVSIFPADLNALTCLASGENGRASPVHGQEG